MTAERARTVLNDCREVLRQLRDNPAPQQWRILWVAALALLRTVREVLRNVDGERDDLHPKLKHEIGGFWKRMKETEPEPAIYWEIICGNANGILHQYKLGAVMVQTFAPSVIITGRSDVSVSAAVATAPILRPGALETERNYWMKDGPFKDHDQRDIVQQAIDWWEGEIGTMEQRAQH
jgi:hypothetical protein